jgi:hypothetical protein
VYEVIDPDNAAAIAKSAIEELNASSPFETQANILLPNIEMPRMIRMLEITLNSQIFRDEL